MIPEMADRGYTRAQCGCEFSGGSWGVCAQHAKPHSEHVTKAPWCDACYQESEAPPDDVQDYAEDTEFAKEARREAFDL